jgi:hypothetical protein
VEDDIIYWQDILESVLAGRTANLQCPFCYDQTLEVTRKERTTLIACKKPTCRQFVEGRLGDEESV